MYDQNGIISLQLFDIIAKRNPREAMHFALKSRSILMMNRALEWGADINAVDENGQTLLHQSIRDSDIGSIEMLCQYGANPTIEDNTGCSPIFLALTREENIKSYLLKYSIPHFTSNIAILQSMSHIFDSAEKRIENIAPLIEMIKRCKADNYLNGLFDLQGNRLLHYLILSNYPAYVIDIVLRNFPEIDFSIMNNDNLTPLQLAERFKDDDVAMVIRKHMAKPVKAMYRSKPYPTQNYFALVQYIDTHVATSSVLAPKSKASLLFKGFLNFITRYDWHYDPTLIPFRETLLEQEHGYGYVVDCYSLSNALWVMFKAYGIHDIERAVMNYDDYDQTFEMRVPNQTYPGILGTYQCFDIVKQAKMVKDGRVTFTSHQMLKRSNEDYFYDPVFSCCYTSTQAIPVFELIPSVVSSPENPLPQQLHAFELTRKNTSEDQSRREFARTQYDSRTRNTPSR